jgi:hypothetical protein
MSAYPFTQHNHSTPKRSFGMPLLEIKPTKKITIICSIDESTATTINQYAAFAKASADDVVNKALEYTFNKDAEFQKYRSTNPVAPTALRVKKPATAPSSQLGARRGPKPAISIAAD